MKPPVTLRMLIIWLMLGLFVSGCDSTTATAPVSSVTPPPVPDATLDPKSAFQKGIVYASWWHGEYSSSESDKTLAQSIKPLGVNWISIVVTCYQQRISSAHIQCKPETYTPTDADLAHIIQDAHRSGLRVMLKPHIDLAGESKHWRGEIGSGTDEAAWQTWFKSYTAFITHYATIAQDNGADYFVVGTELVNTSYRTENWRSVIKTVRNIYHGPLTYSAHHLDEEFAIDWWDALDAIGIDAYYPLAQNEHPRVAQIKAAWVPIVSRLSQLSKKWARPVILTEVGYESIEGANRTPWQTRGHTIEYEEQADSYQALFEAFSGQAWWHGVYWWVWTVHTARDSALNHEFTACNKPAEDILRKNYGAQPHSPPPPILPSDEDQTDRLVIYHSALGTDWEDWSWDATIGLATSKNEQHEKTAIRILMNPWGALSLHHPGTDTTPYNGLEFYLYVGKNTERRFLVSLNDASDRELSPQISLPNPRYLEGGKFVADRWQKIRIPFADMGSANTTIARLNIKDDSGKHPLEFFIDEISLTGAAATQAEPPATREAEVK